MKAAATITALVIALAAAPAASADPPTRITIVAVFDPLTYGENAYVNGQLFGDAQAGQAVALEQSGPPFTDWTPVAQVTADAVGYYSFKLHPSQTMRYRTSSQGVGSERVVQVAVAPRIAFDAHFDGGSAIRFSGRFAPALAGQSIAIQRRVPSGWKTVASARLRAGKTFAGRIRAHRSTTLRAFFATDGAHLDARSRTIVARPGANAAAARMAHAARIAASCRAPSITRIATRPDPPVARKAMSLRVTATMPAGRVKSVDVLWGEGDKRDHFTLAPAFRKRTVTFTLRHRYAGAGSYKLRIRVAGVGCAQVATTRPSLRVIRGPETYQP